MATEHSSIGRKLLSASVLRGANMFAAAMVSFFMMPFLVRHLGDRGYGFWALATTFISYYSMLDAGLAVAVSQHMSVAIGRKNEAECRTVFNTALRIQSLLGGIALLATFGFAVAAPWICRTPEDARLFSKIILILGITVAVGFPVRVYGGVLEAELRFDIRAWVGLLTVTLRTVLFVWVVLAGGGLVALAWVTMGVSAADLILQTAFARREAKWARIEGKLAELKEAKGIISYSVYTSIAYVADILRFQVDSLVITGFVGLAAVTHYKVAGVFTQYYLQLIFISVGMLWPVLSRFHGAGDQSRIEEVFFSGTKLACCISVFICLGLIGWGKPFIARWMGNRYEDGYLPLVALSVAVLLDVSQKPSVDLLYATFKNRVYVWINWIEGILNLAFSIVLARPLGIFGVALGTLVAAFLVRMVLQPWWVCKVTGFQYGHYMRFLGKYLLLCTGLATSAIAVSAWGLKSSYPLIISSAMCATVLYAVGSWFVIFDRREREIMLRALRRKNHHKEADQVTVAVPAQ